MRRTLAAGLLALATTTALLTTVGSAAARPSSAEVASRAERLADTALARATATLSGSAGASRDATMALLDLRRAYPDLSRAEKAQADAVFARPVATRQKCGVHVCVHYTIAVGENRTKHAWAQTTLNTMESVWRYEVGTRGYRAPASDDNAAGTPQFDVYLENLLDDGLYGYCSTENPVPAQPYRYDSYCVLDNDYAGYPLGPLPSLRVTAAHEFFHAIQFNYDAGEDKWLMEATATWMEERYADGVNDSRAYLPYGQLKRPGISLDKFAGATHYGNWVFFERLSQRYGADAIRSIWRRLDATVGKTDDYSVQGVRGFLATRHVALPRFYADFASGNLFPAKVYSEGRAYPKAPVSAAYSLSRSRHAVARTSSLPHLTSRSFQFTPTRTLRGSWRLRITVNGPNTPAGPAAYVQVVLKNGNLSRLPMRLSASGTGSVKVNFTRAKVARVTLTLANAGTQYSCWQGRRYACQGISRNDGARYAFTANAVR